MRQYALKENIELKEIQVTVFVKQIKKLTSLST